MSNALKKRWVKLTNSEFWPFLPVYLPAIFSWMYYAIRAWHPLFFSAANPSIYSGGMTGESKKDIYDLIPEEFIPNTLFVASPVDFEQFKAQIIAKGIEYPFVVKPDRGEKGTAVKKIDDEAELKAYHDKFNGHMDFIVQAYVDYPEEYGVYYCRYPNEAKGEVFSLTMKEFLRFEGDGQHTVRQLLAGNNRALFQLEALEQKFPGMLDKVYPKGAQMLLEPIGNHARGTTFLDGNKHIDQQMNESFDAITAQIPGVYLCRYDLKCQSLADLRLGQNFKIIEINGVGADPAHMYDPSCSIFGKWSALVNLWGRMYKVAVQNHRKGVAYLPVKTFKAGMDEYNAYLQNIRAKL
jgi:hypothetical protein